MSKTQNGRILNQEEIESVRTQKIFFKKNGNQGANPLPYVSLWGHKIPFSHRSAIKLPDNFLTENQFMVFSKLLQCLHSAKGDLYI